jgi:cyclopropane fatty-acyl-phospholipid synthase-like methyltransferase
MSFDHIAPIYNIGENFFFGNRLNLARTVFTDELMNSRSVLLLGEGRGKFLEELLAINHCCSVTIVDSSTRMIRYQKSKVTKANFDRVNFHCVSIETFTTNQKFDLICSFFFWDCFTVQQINKLVPSCIKLLLTKGLWINSDFIDLMNQRNYTNYFKIRLLYLFFHLTTGIRAWRVEPFKIFAEANGLRLLKIDETKKNFISTELYQKII